MILIYAPLIKRSSIDDLHLFKNGDILNIKSRPHTDTLSLYYWIQDSISSTII